MCTECHNSMTNLNNCSCTYTSCSRRGHCCECIAYHKDSNQLPACFFDAATEATYDRSIDNFVKMYNKKRGK